MSERLREDIDDQAAIWAARSLSGAFSQEDETSLQVWLSADARHAEAFDAYMGIANRASAAADFAAEEVLEKELESYVKRSDTRRNWIFAAPALAASLAGAAIFISTLMNPATEYAVYATARGEMEEINLPDGSVVALNTNTEIQVRFDDDQRTVRLTKGEALFDVTRDTDRPFVVTSEHARTSVLGTRFNVYETADKAVVSVLSGVVEVAAKESHAPLVTLIAGHELAIDASRGRQDIRSFKPDAVTSWRRGRAYHENEPLSAVVADLNRYFSTEIVIGDPSLSDIPVTGGFDVTDQFVAIEALSIALSLRTERQDGPRIILYPDE